MPFGDSVDEGDTVSVNADVNFYTTKYEIEYFDEVTQTWKLYQTLEGTGWDYTFSCEFTSNEGKSLKFRIKAYTEGNVYDEENGVWLDELACTSEEFTITWKPHVHTYSANPNKKDENNHWKECIDPKCTDTENKGKIEVAPHKAIGGNCQTEAACACGKMLLGSHIMSDWIQEDGQHFRECIVEGCTHAYEKAPCSGGTATCTEKAKCDTCGKDYGEILPHTHGTAWVTDANNHWNECSCGDKANVAPHADANSDGKCDTCEYPIPINTPEDTTPAGTTPADTTPQGTTPVDTTPQGTTPVDTTPQATTPVATTPQGTVTQGTNATSGPANAGGNADDGLGLMIIIIIGAVAAAGGIVAACVFVFKPKAPTPTEPAEAEAPEGEDTDAEADADADEETPETEGEPAEEEAPEGEDTDAEADADEEAPETEEESAEEKSEEPTEE